MIELVKIPSGSFLMGSPEGEGDEDERPQHEVQLKEFWMGKYPVTQEQWKRVAAMPNVARNLEADPSYIKGDRRPVEQVNFHDAEEFCDRLSNASGQEYRLPTEAEWEYACRAGTTTPFYFGEVGWGDVISPGFVNYNCSQDFPDLNRRRTTDVGHFPPNAWGLYDMHGNVWEWCLDGFSYDSYADKPPSLRRNGNTPWWPTDDDKSRIIRGGSWARKSFLCRSAARNSWHPIGINNDIGFRVVCEVDADD
jgi:formylglycine-generating enzyme required for sulfatase activity